MTALGRIAATVVLITPLLAVGVLRGQSPEFTYSGAHGPTQWGATPGWEACRGSASARQSPIAIDKVAVDATLQPLTVTMKETPVNLVNNGHTIEEEYEPGSAVTVGGVTYGLAQFHFHYPSEHTIHGHQDVLELHAVFAQPGSDKKVVIGQLFTVGAANPFLAHLLQRSLPAKNGQHVASHDEINIAEAFSDLAHYYTYSGSLTTPPCSETVTWFVLDREAQLSQAQLNAFHASMVTNARPVQPLNGRTVRATPGA